MQDDIELKDEELFDGWDDDDEDVEIEPEDDSEKSDGIDDEEETNPAEDDEDESDDDADDEDEDKKGDPDEDDPEDKPENTDQFFELKYMGESKKVNAEEIIPLAQKGLDYDRIRAERDNLKTKQAETAELEMYREFLDEIAKGSNLDINALIDQTKAKMIIAAKRASGEEISEADALKEAKSQRETKMKAKSAPADKTEEEKKVEEEQAQQSKRQESFKRFIEDYPEVKAESIPKEVWADYTAGKGDLSDLYTRYENKRLKEELETERKNKKNKDRSTGSRKSTGKSEKNKWYDGWDDDE